MRHRRGIAQPLGAARMGMSHAAFCIGCCWALFAVLVAVGTMSIGWMVALTLLIVLESRGCDQPAGEIVGVRPRCETARPDDQESEQHRP